MSQIFSYVAKLAGSSDGDTSIQWVTIGFNIGINPGKSKEGAELSWRKECQYVIKIH